MFLFNGWKCLIRIKCCEWAQNSKRSQFEMCVVGLSVNGLSAFQSIRSVQFWVDFPLPHNGTAWKMCSLQESNTLAKRENKKGKTAQTNWKKHEKKNHWHFPIHFCIASRQHCIRARRVKPYTNQIVIFFHSRLFNTSRFIRFRWIVLSFRLFRGK